MAKQVRDIVIKVPKLKVSKIHILPNPNQKTKKDVNRYGI